MNDSDPYRPVDCARYSELEVAILHRTPLHLQWTDPDGTTHIGRLLPRDLRTRDHAEFLLAVDENGEAVEIRLDRIVRFTS
ncbi:Rho-binding antiterminator [Thiohalobacter sp.]|uniref:Rho-binding antiterminator n=1 Tax=Thiohalobacter sp. TaxID=2025948 RepID=UPI002633E7DE|nr:Rho-binding antiterminator [Thiohalobacter sp.]